LAGLLPCLHAAPLEEWALDWLTGDGAPSSVDPAALGEFLMRMANRYPDGEELSAEQRDSLERALEVLERFCGKAPFSEPARSAQTRLRGKLGKTDHDRDRDPSVDRLMDVVRRMNDKRTAGLSDEAQAAAREGLALQMEIGRIAPGLKDRDPRLAFALVDLGMCFRETGAVDAAEEAFRRALIQLAELSRNQPSVPELLNAAATGHNHLGLLYLDTGRLAQAEGAFRNALAVREEIARDDPSNVENAVYRAGALCNLGHVSGDQGRVEEAIGHYDRSIDQLRAVLEEHAEIGMARQFLANAGEGRSAVRDLEADASSPPEGVSTLHWRPPGPLPELADHGVPIPASDAREAFEAERYEEAIRSLEELLSTHPGDVDAWFWKGRAWTKLAGYSEAVASLEEALRLKPDHLPARYDLSDLLRFLNRDEEALGLADEILAGHPEHAAAWRLRGLILARFLDAKGASEELDPQRLDSAIESFDRAILLDPDCFEARLYKGKTLSMACAAAQTRLALLADFAKRRQGTADPERHLRPHYLLYHCYFDRARESFDEAVRIRPDDARPWYEKGTLLADGDPRFENRAGEAFHRAVELEPEFADAWFALAQLCGGQGRKDEAADFLNRAIAADPALKERAEKECDWLDGGVGGT
jgi:tetratricopeptide (TPR) repeat protein